MSDATIKALRRMGQRTPDGDTGDRYKVILKDGCVLAFDLTKDRAEGWCRYYLGARIQKQEG